MRFVLGINVNNSWPALWPFKYNIIIAAAATATKGSTGIPDLGADSGRLSQRKVNKEDACALFVWTEAVRDPTDFVEVHEAVS